MGSDLYRVTVLAAKRTAVSLDVIVIHPDAMHIPPDPSFALMMIHEAARPSDPLAREVAFENTLDTAWVTQYAKGFIRTVKVRNIKRTRTSMRGRMDITVSDPAWIAHLAKDASWESRAFSLTRTYDAHAPIHPDEATRPTAGEGFVWVPRECFMDFHDVPDDTPALLEMPAYASSAYTAGERIEKPTLKQLKAWVGRAVISEDGRGSGLGTIVGVTKRGAVFAKLTDGSRSFGGEAMPLAIARPVFSGKRLGTKLDQAKLLRSAAVITTGGRKSGTTLELELRIPPDGRKLPIASATDVLHVLAKEAIDDSEFKRCPLATSLIADLAAQEMEGAHRAEEIYPFVATNYVASFTIESPARVPKLKLTGSSDEIRAALAGPWPTATLRIVVTDKRWLAHVDPARRIVLPEWSLPKPKAPPKPTPAPVHKPADARVVLYTDSKVWIAERDGKRWTARWGKRSRKDRQSKAYTATSPEAAQTAIDKTVASKLREGYQRAPSRDDAAALIRKRTGLEVIDASGVCVIAKPHPIDRGWYKPKDQIHQLSNAYVSTVEELAVVIDAYRGKATVSADSYRPAAGSYTNVHISLS